jgi:tetratricopeptide (TPR) repeat protein
MLSNLGESARLRGDYQAAVELYQKALAVVREIGHRDSEAIYLNNLSGALIGLRQFESAETQLRNLIARSAAPTCTLSETYRFLSEACLGQGKMAEALAAAQRALMLAQKSENGLDLGGAWRALGRAVAKLGRQSNGASAVLAASTAPIADPGVCFAESLRVFKQMSAEGEQARTLRVWAKFDLEQGRTEEARQKSKAAREMFLRLGMPLAVERTDTWL